MAKKVSYSELSLFFTCNRAWYLKYRLKMKGSDTMPLIMGTAIHRFVKGWVHRKTKIPREIFFLTQDTAVNSYTRYWINSIWPKYSKNFDDSSKWAGLNASKKFLVNYMTLVKGRGQHYALERKLKAYVVELGCTLVGDIDQIRSTNLTWLKKERPEWYAQKEKDGQLENSHVLIDLKTGNSNVFYSSKENVSEETQMRKQTSLINNFQPTMYYYLYYRNFGKFPDAFVYWFLGEDPKFIPTYRNEEDFKELFDLVRVFLENIDWPNIEHFPKTPVSNNCTYCKYWNACWYDRKRPDISKPIPLTDKLQPYISYEPVEKSETKVSQPRLKKIYAPRQRKLTDEEKAQKEKEEYERRMSEKKD